MDIPMNWRISTRRLRWSLTFLSIFGCALLAAWAFMQLGCLKCTIQQIHPLTLGFTITAVVVAIMVLATLITWINTWLLSQQERRMKENYDRLNRAVNASGAGVWLWDIHNNKITWDDVMHRLFGVDRQHSPTTYEDTIKLILPDDQHAVNHDVQRSIIDPTEFETEFRVQHPDQSIHYINAKGKIFLDYKKNPSFLTGICVDVTDRRIEEDTLFATKAAAEQASQLKSNFMATISHELRSPLTGIIGFAELMYHEKVGAITPEHKEYLGDILTSSRHLLLLINDVLDIAKVESGRMEFYPEKVDITKTLTETREIFKTMIDAKHIKVNLEIDPSHKQLYVDPSRFKQVLYNYVSNALKYTPDNGVITLRIKAAGDHLFRLEVEDNGIGIRESDMSKLFVEFQQLDREIARKYPSTGLGLALTKHIVEAQGGRVEAQSVFGKGSTFIAILPNTLSTTGRQSTIGNEKNIMGSKG